MKYAVAAVILAAAAPAAAANLVVNGGFEASPAPSGGYSQYFGGNSFTGWTVTGNDVIVIDKNYQESGLVFNPNGGNNAIDLTGAGNTGPADGITQTIATVAGRKYTLSFFVGNASPTGGNGTYYTLPSTLNLSINGGALLNFTNATNDNFAINWRAFTTTFVATGATTLAFSNGTPAADNMLGLDDVTLTGAVPEPATWTMLIVGFGLVGYSARRRTRTLVTA